MGKRSRVKTRDQQAETTDGAGPGPRQPCPCGSGRRYKHCHGAEGGAEVFVRRPFEGMPSEADVVALRELVPSATAPLTVLDDPDREVLLCTLLPGAVPAMVRESGAVWLGLQVQHNFGDPARDLGAVLTRALDLAADGRAGVVGLTEPPGAGPRLQDLVDVAAPLEVTVHDGFGFWVADVDDPDGSVAEALARADEAIAPTARLTQVEAAYWTDVSTKEHLRWAMTEPEGEILDALARLHVAGEDVLVPGSRLVGMFRAHGLLVPVWDLPLGTGPEALEDPAEAFATRLAASMRAGEDLTAEERSARSGLANRQVTLR
jgi:hypothetical protein